MTTTGGREVDGRGANASDRMAPVNIAREAPSRLGALAVQPAHRRLIHDDGREELLEPRVMQVLVALVRAGGEIVTRDELAMSCWGGVVVGEDALNRTIGRLRRLSEGVGAGAFRVETITKVGYRLVAAGAGGRAGDFAPEDAPLALPTGPIAAPGRRPTLAIPAKPSIAVLPFKNVSGDPDKEYLADAITEDIVTALAQWRWFFVIARHSSFTYKDQAVEAARIGNELGVRYLLTGSVRTIGERIRVNVRLTDAVDGVNLWADRYDRDLAGLLALDDEITEQVAASIEPAIIEMEGVRTARAPAADFSALDCLYRGMSRLNRMTSEMDEEALGLFREAVRLDPDLALGHSGIARVLYGRAIYGAASAPMDELGASLAAARQAIRLDSRDAYGYFAAAGASLYLGDHAGALSDAKRAIALNPSFAYAQYRLGQVLIFAGSPDLAIAPIERSLRLSPYDPQVGPMLETLALAHYQNGDYAGAARHARIAGRVGGAGSSVLAAALARLGELEEAAEAFEQASHTRRSPQRPMRAPYADPAHLDHLREAYRLAGMMPKL
ncbi:MAG TPA: winged helix-turn-helix domain-containing protein [Caulobacteraceae bacterium]|nr:winged helix-turn-helix domain-containing protein [Caulobacteraceae bacterium]